MSGPKVPPGDDVTDQPAEANRAIEDAAIAARRAFALAIGAAHVAPWEEVDPRVQEGYRACVLAVLKTWGI
jgi:hypothetical protein